MLLRKMLAPLKSRRKLNLVRCCFPCCLYASSMVFSLASLILYDRRVVPEATDFAEKANGDRACAGFLSGVPHCYYRGLRSPSVVIIHEHFSAYFLSRPIMNDLGVGKSAFAYRCMNPTLPLPPDYDPTIGSSSFIIISTLTSYAILFKLHT